LEDKHLRRVRAVFNPDTKHIDSLKPEARKLIGKEFILIYAWLMGEDDPFPNVWALTFVDNSYTAKISWIPEFDLDIIEIL